MCVFWFSASLQAEPTIQDNPEVVDFIQTLYYRDTQLFRQSIQPEFQERFQWFLELAERIKRDRLKHFIRFPRLGPSKEIHTLTYLDWRDKKGLEQVSLQEVHIGEALLDWRVSTESLRRLPPLEYFMTPGAKLYRVQHARSQPPIYIGTTPSGNKSTPLIFCGEAELRPATLHAILRLVAKDQKAEEVLLPPSLANRLLAPPKDPVSNLQSEAQMAGRVQMLAAEQGKKSKLDLSSGWLAVESALSDFEGEARQSAMKVSVEAIHQASLFPTQMKRSYPVPPPTLLDAFVLSQGANGIRYYLLGYMRHLLRDAPLLNQWTHHWKLNPELMNRMEGELIGVKRLSDSLSMLEVMGRPLENIKERIESALRELPESTRIWFFQWAKDQAHKPALRPFLLELLWKYVANDNGKMQHTFAKWVKNKKGREALLESKDFPLLQSVFQFLDPKNAEDREMARKVIHSIQGLDLDPHSPLMSLFLNDMVPKPFLDLCPEVHSLTPEQILQLMRGPESPIYRFAISSNGRMRRLLPLLVNNPVGDERVRVGLAQWLSSLNELDPALASAVYEAYRRHYAEKSPFGFFYRQSLHRLDPDNLFPRPKLTCGMVARRAAVLALGLTSLASGVYSLIPGDKQEVPLPPDELRPWPKKQVPEENSPEKNPYAKPIQTIRKNLEELKDEASSTASWDRINDLERHLQFLGDFEKRTLQEKGVDQKVLEQHWQIYLKILKSAVDAKQLPAGRFPSELFKSLK